MKITYNYLLRAFFENPYLRKRFIDDNELPKNPSTISHSHDSCADVPYICTLM